MTLDKGWRIVHEDRGWYMERANETFLKIEKTYKIVRSDMFGI